MEKATIREAIQTRHLATTARQIKEYYGVDITDSAIDFTSPFFSWKKFRETAYRITPIREASAETTFGALLRAGIDAVANQWYQAAKVTYTAWAQQTVSSQHSSFYAPLNRAGLPRRTGAGENFPEVNTRGLDVQVTNFKFGAIIGFERELFDDDQTGQIRDRAAGMGENSAIVEEAWTYARLIGSATTFGGDAIPASETKPADETFWPWSTTLVGGGSNRPVAYAPLTADGFNAARVALLNQLDLLGNPLLVMSDTLIVSPEDESRARTLLNSAYFPAVPSATPGDLGASFGMNPFQGQANLIVSRFMPSGAWALGQAQRGLIFQRRDPVEIMQENPQAGPAFSQDVYRFRSRARWNVDWIDPRFWFLGNDGTA